MQCSTFQFDHINGPIFGKNVDYPTKTSSKTMILINPRGEEKEPILFEGIHSMRWKAKYGSLTFTGYGKDLPNGGMNENGLILEPMSLGVSKYPEIDSTPRLVLGQWKQYLLDTFGSVQEVIENVGDVLPFGHASHFLLADASGDCAALEFLNGEPVVYTGTELDVRAITNHSYSECRRYASDFTAFGGERDLPETHGSLENFIQIAVRLKSVMTSPPSDPVAYAYTILDSVSLQGLTKRSTVYDIGQKKIYFRTEIGGDIGFVYMDKFNFDQIDSTLMIDVDSGRGDCTESADLLTREENCSISRSFCDTLLSAVPAETPVPLLSINLGQMLEKMDQYSHEVTI